MPNREVSVALCGAVVGVILGVASVAVAQDGTLAARVPIPWRPQIDIPRRSARTVNTRADRIKEEQRERSENRHQIPATGEAAPVGETTIAEDRSACTVVTAAINDLVARALVIVPETPVTNTERRLKIRAAGDAIITAHCPPVHESAPADDDQARSGFDRDAQLAECIRRYPRGAGDRKYERCVRFNDFLGE